MGFKLGVVVGFGAGYVLGARAGRERYEELKSSWDQFMGNPSVQSAVGRGREAAAGGAQAGIRAVGRATDNVKGRLEGDSPGTS
jgi:hypothetical protein